MFRRLLDGLRSAGGPKSEQTVAALPEGTGRLLRGGVASESIVASVPSRAPFTAETWFDAPPAEHVAPDLIHPQTVGIDVVSARELMEANRALIEQALEAFQFKDHISDFDKQLVEMVRRFAHWVGPLPASRTHHHTGRGGLFNHSLGVAVAALHMSVSKNVNLESTPRERDADTLAWQLIAFVGGLLHDVGKVHTLGQVYGHTFARTEEAGRFRPSSSPKHQKAWQPMVEGFENWAQGNNVLRYCVRFETKEPMGHADFTARFVMALVPRPLLAFIYNSNNVVRRQFEDFLRNPNSGAKTPIFEVLHTADHLNVAMAVDPQRLPGAIELSSLVMRRFTEFATEAAWNLPGAPFVYANVQVRSEFGLRFLGMPMFVASETNMRLLSAFITERPQLGVSFGPRLLELVFNSLEAGEVMSRTIEGLLPRQILIDDMAPYVPASRALIRFRANQSGVIIPLAQQHEDQIVEAPVVPINVRVPLHVQMNAPTLAFHEEPASASAAALPVVIENGSVAPQDLTLRNDTEFSAVLKRTASAVGLSEDERLGLSTIAPRRAPKREQVHDGLRLLAERGEAAADPPALAPETADGPAKGTRSKNAGARTKDRGRSDKTPATVSAVAEPEAPVDQLALEFATAKPADVVPSWMTLYAELSADADSISAELIWAPLWLFLQSQPFPKVIAYEVRSGIYAIRCRELPMTLRHKFLAALKDAGLPLALLARHWPNENMKAGSDLLSASLDTLQDMEEGPSVRLRPRACEMVEDILERQTAAGQGDRR